MSTANSLEHVTVAGDRWDLLAWRYYGDARGYERIIAANPGVAMTPLLPAGLTLTIPVIIETVVIDLEALPPWMR